MISTASLRFQRNHVPGFDCRLATFRNTLASQGFRLSNGMALGLSGSLCFLYLRDTENRLPYYTLGGVTDQTLEGLAVALNCYVSRGKRDLQDPVAPFLREWLDAGTPVNVAVFRPELEVLRTGQPLRAGPTSVGFHYVTLTECDADGRRFVLFETHTAEAMVIGLEDLVRIWFYDRFQTRAVRDPYQPCDGYWYTVRPPSEITTLLPRSIAHSLHRVVHNFFSPSSNGIGLPALRRFQSDAPSWPSLLAENSSLPASLPLMRVMEGPLTGGGFGRRLFASFLGEASELLPAPELRAIGRMFRRSAEGWRQFVGEVSSAVRAGDGEKGARDGMQAAVERWVDLLVAQEVAQMEALREWGDTRSRRAAFEPESLVDA